MDKRLFTLLIIIALGIWANFLATLFMPTPTLASGDVMDVNIKKVGGTSLSYGDPIPVNVDEIGGLMPSLTFAIPVDVQ